MLAIERRRKIISMLEEKNSVLVPDLSKLFNVTEETIRRDLEKLEKEGLLKRTYGGAIANDNMNVDLPVNIREVTNPEGKGAIGKKVCEFIQDGDTVIIDSSTTALQVAKNIKLKKNLTVITNSMKIISELSNEKDISVISTGGKLREKSMSFVGPLAENSLKKYNVDKAIICCKGIDMERDITESNELEAEVKRTMIASADKVFLVVDYTKFNKKSFVKMMRLEEIDTIFTDKKLDGKWEKLLQNKDIELIYS